MAYLSSILSKSLKVSHLDKKLASMEFFPHWREIIGEELAEHSVPTNIIRGNKLVVKVSNPCWLSELTLQKREILAKIAERNEGAKIEDIIFKV